jgi:hypothetical protein
MREAVVIRQRAKLPGGRFDQPLLAPAQRYAPQPRQALEIVSALVVIDEDALAGGDDQGAVDLVFLGIRVGMQVIGNVAARGRIRADGHRRLLLI